MTWPKINNDLWGASSGVEFPILGAFLDRTAPTSPESTYAGDSTNQPAKVSFGAPLR